MEKIDRSLAPNHNVRPALILGLHGVLFRTKSGMPYPENMRDIELMPNIQKQIKAYKDLGYVIGILGQDETVGLGLKLPKEAQAEMDYMTSLFEDHTFNMIKISYSVPNSSIFPFMHRSINTLPSIGFLGIMEREAYQSHVVIDWDKSLYVYGSDLEMQTAVNGNIQKVEADFFLSSTVVTTKDPGKKDLN